MSEFLSGLASGGASGLLKLATGSLGSLLDTAINGSWRTQARFQRDMQKQLMSHQAELNREQYDYEMSQESPAAQRQRLEAAGLNPALMMSGAGGSSGISASVGSVSGGSAGMPHTPGLGLPNISLAELSQIKANEALSRVYDADAKDKLYDLERKKQQDEGGLAGYELSTAQYESETAKLTRDLVEQDIISRRLENRIKDVNARIATATADTIIAQSEWELEKLMSEVASIEWQNLYHKARGERAKELVEREFALMASQIGLFNSQSALYRQQTKTEEERTKFERAMAVITENDAFKSSLIREAFDMFTRDGKTVSMAFKDMVREEFTRVSRNADLDANYFSIVLDRLLSSIGRMLGAGRQLFSIGNILEN